MAEGSRGTRFAPTVLAGLITAALTAVASAKPWFRFGSDSPTLTGVPDSQTSIDMPLALALSLVVLAGWGALLVSRGALRRVCAAIALLAALGVVSCAAAAPFVLPDDLRDQVGTSARGIATHPTGWFLAAAVASVLSAVVLVDTWRLAPRWPTMGSRYDAPAARQTQDADTDLWKALDEGRDPTDPADPAAS